MELVIAALISLVAGVVIGGAVMFMVLRKNKRLLSIEDILEDVTLAQLGALRERVEREIVKIKHEK